MDMYTDKLIRYTLAIVLVGASDTRVAMADAMRSLYFIIADNKVHAANMGTTWGRQGPRWAPCWPHEFCFLRYNSNWADRYLTTRLCNIKHDFENNVETCKIPTTAPVNERNMTPLKINNKINRIDGVLQET